MKVKFLTKCFTLTSIIALALLTGCKKEAPQAKPDYPAIVEMMTVEKKTTPFESIYVGIVEGSKAVEVRAQVGGILRERHYEEGSFVKAGDVLFTIESDSYEAALKVAKGNVDLAKAQLRQAKLDYDRLSNLYQTNSISKKDYDAAVAAYESAKAQLESAQGSLNDSKIRLGYTKVVAPVSGYTSKANYTEGNLISTGSSTPLTVINQVDPVHVSFSVPAQTYTKLMLLQKDNKIKVAKNLSSTVYAGGEHEYPEKGKVIFLDKMITPSTGAIKVKAEFANKNMALLPGQYVRTTLDGFALVDAVLVPQQAVMIRNNNPVVIVVNNGVAEFKPVKIGMTLGENIYIESGLNGGETIVTEGLNKVRPGGKVMNTAQMKQAMQAKQAQENKNENSNNK